MNNSFLCRHEREGKQVNWPPELRKTITDIENEKEKDRNTDYKKEMQKLSKKPRPRDIMSAHKLQNETLRMNLSN